ncbi:unnamed protein product [Amoebophrya sp. A120]|nr:unnamed protein product [Amoebophrya sp. A120]|eukprot:GSA120T00011813001.1
MFTVVVEGKRCSFSCQHAIRNQTSSPFSWTRITLEECLR